jgi:hypothetical protein
LAAADVDTWPAGAQDRFFEFLQAGDRVTLRRFVAGMLDADVDRGDRLRVTFAVTLPELIGADAIYPDEITTA